MSGSDSIDEEECVRMLDPEESDEENFDTADNKFGASRRAVNSPTDRSRKPRPAARLFVLGMVLLVLLATFAIISIVCQGERSVSRSKQQVENQSIETPPGSIDLSALHVAHENVQQGSRDELPPLSSLISNKEEGIIGDVSFLLDFAIVGHPKTATTEHMYWLAEHPEISMRQKEIHSMGHHQPAELVETLYKLKPGKRGYKSPHELQRKHVVEYYRKYFPTTKLIVGLRHPVRWFESHYNFNWRMGNELPPAETYSVADPATAVSFVNAGFYHENLARLAKTNLTDPVEFELLGRLGPDNSTLMPNPVFLYDVSQMFDKNLTRRDAYRKELSAFLGLEKPLSPENDGREDKVGADYHYKIDICESTYDALRAEIMHVSRNASKWIEEYFLDLPDVYFSSPDHFRSLLRAWKDDPCLQL